MCIFFELQPESDSRVGINVATWKITKKRKVKNKKTDWLFPRDSKSENKEARRIVVISLFLAPFPPFFLLAVD